MPEDNKPAKRFLITDIAFPGSTKPHDSSRNIITSSQKPGVDPMMVAPENKAASGPKQANVSGPPDVNNHGVGPEPHKLLEIPARTVSSSQEPVVKSQDIEPAAADTMTDQQYQTKPDYGKGHARPKNKKHQQLKAIFWTVLLTILIIVAIVFLAAGTGLIHISFKSITNFIDK